MNLKEFANLVGLSQTTVSRALNGYPEVKQATRDRVLEAARKYKYSPNRRATSLATGRSMAIGHIIQSANQREMVNPIFGDFVAGAAEIYEKNGYDMLFSYVSTGNEKGVYQDLKQKSIVDGVIVQAPSIKDSRIELLKEIGLPFVVHGRSTGVTQDYDWLDINNKRSFQRATEFLLDLGHTKIALINGVEEMDFAQRRRNGYISALASRGIEPNPLYMSAFEMSEIYGYQQTKNLLNLKNAPTAILISSMISAIGVRRAVEEAGLTIGKDISLITHDDDLSYLKNGADIPIFTATRSSVHLAGKLIAEILLSKISNPNSPPKHVLLESELVVGSSTGPAPR